MRLFKLTKLNELNEIDHEEIQHKKVSTKLPIQQYFR
jgi:hypothetical protein